MRVLRGQERTESDRTEAGSGESLRRFQTGSKLVQVIPRGRRTKPAGRRADRRANRRLDIQRFDRYVISSRSNGKLERRFENKDQM